MSCMDKPEIRPLHSTSSTRWVFSIPAIVGIISPGTAPRKKLHPLMVKTFVLAREMLMDSAPLHPSYASTFS